jgi:hypothetical protein
MKKKQAWKVMSAVLAGTLVFSDAVPLHASASAGTEKSAVQNETVSGTENGTETKTKRAAVYVNLKTGDDTADGTTAETAVKTVEKAQELLAVAAAELQADGKTTEKTLLQIPAKRQRRKQQKNIWYSSAWMKKSWKRIERNSRKQTSGEK